MVALVQATDATESEDFPGHLTQWSAGQSKVVHDSLVPVFEDDPNFTVVQLNFTGGSMSGQDLIDVLDLALGSTDWRTGGALTAADVLAALLTVDGASSLLDADLLDGNQASAFALAWHNHSSTYQPLDADLTALAAAGNSSVLAATTASFTTADETKLDGLSAGTTISWVSLLGGKVWVRASGTAAQIAAISAALDQTVAGVSKYTLTAASVHIESVTARLEAAETSGRTSMIIDIPAPGDATSVDLAPRPVAFRLNPASSPAWAIAATASNIALSTGRMTIETTGHTAASAQGMTLVM